MNSNESEDLIEMKVSKRNSGSIVDMQNAFDKKLQELEGCTSVVEAATGSIEEMLAAFNSKLQTLESTSEPDGVMSATDDSISTTDGENEVDKDSYIQEVMTEIDEVLKEIPESIITSWNWNKLEDEKLSLLVVKTTEDIVEYLIPYQDLSFTDVSEDVRKILKATEIDKMKDDDDELADFDSDDFEDFNSDDVDSDDFELPTDVEKIDLDSEIQVSNYLDAIMPIIEEKLDDAGIKMHIVEAADGSTENGAIFITIPDNAFPVEMIVEESDMIWSWDYMNRDASNIVKLVKAEMKRVEEAYENGEYDDEVLSTTSITANRHDNYFGETAAFNHGDAIAKAYLGKTISKRKSKAEQPGGLVYEADQLGIDMWDLLEALEGMCADGRAVEHDTAEDSWYEIVSDKRHPVRSLFYDEASDPESIWSSTEIIDSSVDVEPGDEEIVYGDPDGMFGEAGTASLAEIKEYWSREHNNDPSLSYYDSFDAWFADTRQWLSNVEACQSTKEVLGYSYDEDSEEDTGWREISSKMVPDSDGFMTDYTLYESTSDNNEYKYICMFGDKDIYTPDESYADWSGDSLGEAEDWFENYSGLDDEILGHTDISEENEPQMCWRVYVDGEITGTFFSDVLANAHAAEFIAQGYDANSVDVVYEEYQESSNEDIMSPEDVIISSSFCYALKHEFGPGTIPKDVDVLNFKEEGYLTIVELDRELTPEELDYYDIRIVE